ncbi:DUF4352 domain-containing protein [Clostridium perfringens]|nr:DUF4352 domain-containing protein [Clostridium perfringens]
MRKLRVGIILAIAIISSVLLTGCSSSKGDKVYNMNEKINVGDLSIEVTGIERVDSIDQFKAEEGKEFLVVKYIMKNNTKDKKECSRIEFKLEDSNNNEINSYFIPEDTKQAKILNIANDKAVQGNSSLKGSVVFQVDEDSTGYTLEFEPKIINNHPIDIKLE